MPVDSPLGDEPLDVVAPAGRILPGCEGYVGGKAADNRLFVEAVLFRFGAGIPFDQCGDPTRWQIGGCQTLRTHARIGRPPGALDKRDLIFHQTME